MSSDIGFEVDGTIGYRIRSTDTAAAEDYTKFAEKAEEIGYSRIGVGEHIALTETMPDDIPYAESGELHFNAENSVHDLFTLLSYYAQATDDIRLASRICIAPLYHPVMLAKKILSIDNLSEGRFNFGAGVGYLSTEFEALGVPFEERGARLDEFLAVNKKVYEDGKISFDGEFHSFPKTGFYPRPVQSPGPPVYIGGASSAAIRRIGQFGDGWMSPAQSPENLEDDLQRVMKAWNDFDRSGKPKISTYQRVYVGDTGQYDDVDLYSIEGSVDYIIEEIQRYIDAGATTMGVVFDVPDYLEQMKLFGEEVIPSFR